MPLIELEAQEIDHVAGKDGRDAVVGYPYLPPNPSAEIQAHRHVLRALSAHALRVAPYNSKNRPRG